jgi:tRNA U54 and U55 pseudouridine synthase Pus10
MQDLKNDFADLENQIGDLLSHLPGGRDLYDRQMATHKAERERKQSEFEAKVKACHPDGNHFPPHEECPLCQKVFQRFERLAEARCRELGQELTEENMDAAYTFVITNRDGTCEKNVSAKNSTSPTGEASVSGG